jgi:hypothetical protein
MRGKRGLVAMQPVVYVAGPSRDGGGKTEDRVPAPSPRSRRLVVDLRIELPIAEA